MSEANNMVELGVKGINNNVQRMLDVCRDVSMCV